MSSMRVHQTYLMKGSFAYLGFGINEADSMLIDGN